MKRYYYYCKIKARRFYVTMADMDLTKENRKAIAMEMHYSYLAKGIYVFVYPAKIKKER